MFSGYSTSQNDGFTVVESTGERPGERYGHCAIADPEKAKMLVFGGVNAGGHFTNELFSFSFQTNSWTREVTSGPQPKGRHFHSAVKYQRLMYVFGGKSNGYMNDLFAFDLDAKKWTSIEALGTPPSRRYGHSAVVYNNCMYVFGGYDDFGLKCNDLWEFNFDTREWRRVKTIGLPPERFHHTAVVYHGSMYVFGGYEGHNDIQEYRFGASTWSPVNTNGAKPCSRWGHKAVIYRGNMYIFGGCDKVINFSDLYKFHFETNTWIKGNCGGYSRRIFETAVVFKDGMYLYGGKNIHNYSFNELHKFTFESPIEPSFVDTYLNDLKHLLYSGEHSDVEFIFLKEGKHLTAHRNILYTRCERFREIINHWLKECVKEKEAAANLAQGKGKEAEKEGGEGGNAGGAISPNALSPVSSPRDTFGVTFFSASSPPTGGTTGIVRPVVSSVSSSFSTSSSSLSLGGTGGSVGGGGGGQLNDTTLRIHIDSCRSDVFIILLEYLYIGMVDIGPKEAFDLLKIADEYKLIHLKSKCENIISQSVNEENVVHLFKLAWQYKAKYLKDYCLGVILENYQKLATVVKLELNHPEMLKEVKKALSAAYVPRPASST